jgi:Septum formation
MTDPMVPGGAGLPDQPLSPAIPAIPAIQAAPDAEEQPAEPPEDQPGQDAPPAWSASPSAPEPAASSDSGAGFGMPTGGGFDAPATGGFGDRASTPPASSEPPWGAPSTPTPGAPVGGWTPGTPLQPASRPPASSRVRSIIIVVVILAVVIGAVAINMFAGKPVGDLQVGDCFDVPTLASESDTVENVQHHPCNQSHTGEVIFVGAYTGGTNTYPAVSDFDTFVGNTCEPVFQAYVGADLSARPDLSIGYFYPLSDGWSSGDRSVTCYATRTDNGPLTASVKGSEAPGASASP